MWKCVELAKTAALVSNEVMAIISLPLLPDSFTCLAHQYCEVKLVHGRGALAEGVRLWRLMAVYEHGDCGLGWAQLKA